MMSSSSSAQFIGEARRPSWVSSDDAVKSSKVISNAAASSKKGDDNWRNARKLILELALHAVHPANSDKDVTDAETTADILSAALDAMKGDVENRERLASLTVDVLWYVGLEVSASEGEAEKGMSYSWKRLCEIVKFLESKGAISKTMLASQLELSLVEGSELGDAKAIKKRLVKENTNRYFRQQKYNLLSEESEGYAKLITELQAVDEGNVEAVVRNVQSLVGYFRLDPNRVFDILLDTYERDVTNGAYVRIFDLFKVSDLSQILGFKFQMYQNESAGAQTPHSLFRLAAQLMATNMLQLDDLLPHLVPTTKDMLQSRAGRLAKMEDALKRVGVVSLNKAAAAKDDAKAADASSEIAAAQSSSAKALKLAGNQKCGLVAGLLSIRAWAEAYKLMNAMGGSGASCNKYVAEVVRDDRNVIRELCKLIADTIQPCYQACHANCICLKPSKTPRVEDDAAASFALKPVTSLVEFLPVVSPLLVCAGHRLASSPGLIARILRVLSVLVSKHGPDAESPIIAFPSGDAAVDKSNDSVKRFRIFARIMGCCIFPSISMLSSPNPGLLHELWAVLEHIPFAARYDMYERWRSGEYPRVPTLKLAAKRAKNSAKQVLKRVAKERDAMRIAGRNFAKVAHLHPTVAFSALLDNIQAYDNMIQVVVDAIKYLTPFGFDVLTYLLLTYLANDRSKLKPDGTSHSHWLASLCRFAGALFAKYHGIEIRGVVLYIIKQLKENKSLDLLLIQEMVAKMSGLEAVGQYSENTLLGLAGGMTLRNNARAAPHRGCACVVGAGRRCAAACACRLRAKRHGTSRRAPRPQRAPPSSLTFAVCAQGCTVDGGRWTAYHPGDETAAPA